MNINLQRRNNNSKNRSDTSVLDAQTLKNYTAAINYYKAKKRGFMNYWNKEINLGINQTTTSDFLAILDDINERWDLIYNDVISRFDIKNNAIVSAPSDQQYSKISDPNLMKQSNNLYSYLFNKFKNTQLANKLFERTGPTEKKFRVAPYSDLGFAYEDFVVQELNRYGYFRLDSLIQSTDSMLTSGQGIRSAGKKVISDVAIADPKRSDIRDKISIQYDIKERSLDLSKLDMSNFLNEDVYGFALKNWQGKAGINNKHKFSMVTALRDEIDEVFKNSWGQKPVSWNKTFAQASANLYVSSRLLDIVGPANVMMMMGRQNMWMDEYIANRFFYINLYYHGVKTKDEIIYIDSSTNGTIYVNIRNPGKDGLTDIYKMTMPRFTELSIEEKLKKGVS